MNPTDPTAPAPTKENLERAINTFLHLRKVNGIAAHEIMAVVGPWSDDANALFQETYMEAARVAGVRMIAAHQAEVARLREINRELCGEIEGICLSLDAHENESSPKWLRGLNARARAVLERAKDGAK